MLEFEGAGIFVGIKIIMYFETFLLKFQACFNCKNAIEIKLKTQASGRSENGFGVAIYYGGAMRKTTVTTGYQAKGKSVALGKHCGELEKQKQPNEKRGDLFQSANCKSLQIIKDNTILSVLSETKKSPDECRDFFSSKLYRFHGK